MHASMGNRLGVAAVAFCAMSAASWAQEDADEVLADEVVVSQSQLWPSRFAVGDDAFTMYPLQLERWERNRLEGRAAVEVQAASADRPLFGVVTVSARTDVDRTSGMVTVHDIETRSGRFPTAAERESSYLDAVRRHLANLTWQVSVERLQADLAIDQSAERSQSEPLRNDPPRIVYVQSPTILVPIDGEPVLREIDSLGLRRVLNTRALILQEQLSNRFFLYVAGFWLEALTLEGPWTEAQVRPIALDAAKRRAEAEGAVDLLEHDQSVSLRAPRVIVSTGPTELVQTDGPPQYAPIGRTDSLFVTNSPNRLFLDLRTQMHYVLLAGRWYRTPSLARGPWEYVLGAQLPADFALIPDDHPTRSVRVAVPGTPEAEEAAIANHVPEFATVKRSAARLEITYDGPAQFRPIAGTSLEAAVNAPVPVIRVDWRTYYALDNGVWFFSDSPDGPWTAASSVPPAVYAIPRSDPLHYVTYVRVYHATPEEVYVGYTPGYIGSYVTVERTVVYGSGWYYRPWIGRVWYATPATWGFGFSFWYSWWDPWPHRVGWIGWRPVPCFRPAWGPWPHRHVGVRVATVTHHRVAVIPAKVWPTHRHGPVAVGTPDRKGNALRADGSGMRDIYRRWNPHHAANSRSGPRPDLPLAGRTRGERDAIASPPGSPQHEERMRRYDRNQRLGDGQRARLAAPHRVRPQDPLHRSERAALPSSPGLRFDRNPRPGNDQPPRVDAPHWVHPGKRVSPQDRAAAPSAPELRLDRDRQPGDGQEPQADPSHRVRPADRASPQDRAAVPSAPELPSPTKPAAAAPGHAPAAGRTLRSPGLWADHPNASRSRAPRLNAPGRLERHQTPRPELRHRAGREDSAPASEQDSRPNMPPRAHQQQRGQLGAPSIVWPDKIRELRSAAPRQHDSRRDRTRPSAAATGPGTDVTGPPRRERPTRNRAPMLNSP